MKKLLFTLVALAMSIVTIAGNFVMLPYSGRAELEKHFSDPNLTVHFYTDTEVFATAERYESSSMVMIDENTYHEKNIYNDGDHRKYLIDGADNHQFGRVLKADNQSYQ